MKIRRVLLLTFATVLALGAPFAKADKVFLKDGRVLDGEIVRQTEGFIYVRLSIGGVGKDELVLRSDIDRIETDAPAVVEKPRRGRGDFDDEPAAEAPRDGATRVCFISLEGTVGFGMYAGALHDSIESIKDDDVDVVILRFDSGGGIGAEVQKLSDVIQNEIKPNYRVAAWIESAISAAAMTASTCEEIYFMSEGNLGAATGFRSFGAKAVHVEGRELEESLQEMVRISARGNRDPLIMRAMQVPTDLSADITSDGTVVWRNDLDGEHIVSTTDGILTFDSQSAVEYKYAQGVADSKDELLKLMGISDWVEVAPQADEIQIRHREAIHKGDAEATKVWQLFQIAADAGEFTRARRYLGQLKGWAKRVPPFADYGTEGGTPPFNDEVFREIERQLDAAARQQRKERSRQRR